MDRTDRFGLAAPVERLVLVDEIVRTRTGSFQAQSLPGHLLHIVTAGEVSQWAEGRAESFGTGSVVWYHEGEPIRGRILRAPWRFITINFLAPALPPPPDDRRVLRAGPDTVRRGRRLLALWRAPATPWTRQLQCHRALLDLLQRVIPPGQLPPATEPAAGMWWRIEKQLRARLEEPLNLDAIQQVSGMSLRTVIRACRAATGMPPMKRLKEIRLGYARGLVQHSDLPLTEIAFRIGYARSQEFSRDYHRRFALTPRDDRKQAPSYRRLERP